MTAVSLAATKLVTALVIFLCGLASTLAPLVLVDNSVLFSAGTMMASGVLLAAALVHQLADSVSTLQTTSDDFPWSFFLCALTFILFLILEESLHLLLLVSDDDETQDCVASLRLVQEGEAQAHGCRGSFVFRSALESADTAASLQNDEKQPLLHHASHKENSSSSNLPPHNSSRRDSRLSIRLFGESRSSQHHHHHHHHHDQHLAAHLHGSIVASLMLLMALCIHSILAGLSIGVVVSTREIYSTAIAIIAHKVFAGYALGSTLVAADISNERCILFGLFFALSTPSGIGIGMLWDLSDDSSRTIAIIKAIVAGTFLYVSIMEVGMKELLICRRHAGSSSQGGSSLSQKQSEVLKLASMLVGFLGMSYLAKFV